MATLKIMTLAPCIAIIGGNSLSRVHVVAMDTSCQNFTMICCRNYVYLLIFENSTKYLEGLSNLNVLQKYPIVKLLENY